MKTNFLRLLFIATWPFVWVYTPFRHAARVLLLRSDGTFLAVKPYFGPNAWQLPGGGIKLLESPEDAIVREIYEELGISVKVSKLLPTKRYVESGFFVKYDIFTATVPSSISLTLNHEIREYAWLPLSNSESYGQYIRAAISANNRSHLVQ